LSQTIPVPPFDLVIFGGTGDLARRKLLPALFHRFRDGQMQAGSRVVGASREPLDAAAYREWVRAALAADAGADTDLLERFLAAVEFVSVDVAGTKGWPELAALLASHPAHVPVHYLAVAPPLFGAACSRLREHGLNGPRSRVVIEKPIGHDLGSARAINTTLAECFAEDQTFRIDHYLGKETVQNLVALRFGNALFEPLWNAAHVDNVQITVAEQLGLESRTKYYDGCGALRDMVQNHLLQLLCIVAMEPPAAFEQHSVRDEKLKVLRALKPLRGADVAAQTVRGQYRAGAIGQAPVPGYAEDVGRADSPTETFIALRAEVANWRWAGVPFYLRTGKRLASRVSEIRSLRTAADGRRPRRPDAVHAPRRDRGGVGLGGPDPDRVGRAPRSPARVSGGLVGPVRRRRARRARGPHVARRHGEWSMNAVVQARAGARVRWWTHADGRTASEALAAEVAIRLRTAIAMRGLASLAVPGGTTPVEFLTSLAHYALDWTRVVVTLTDERWVPERHAASNAALVARTLQRYGAASCTFRPLYVPGLLVRDALPTIEQRLATVPWPLDVVVLGMGLDGHVASLFPGAPQPERPGRVVAAEGPDGLPRASLSADALASARNHYVLIHGRRKQRALRDALDADADGPARPVRAVLEAHAGRTVIHCSDERDG
jgi:glucose-6-phosphate 1-dehydrogenase